MIDVDGRVGTCHAVGVVRVEDRRPGNAFDIVGLQQVGLQQVDVEVVPVDVVLDRSVQDAVFVQVRDGLNEGTTRCERARVSVQQVAEILGAVEAGVTAHVPAGRLAEDAVVIADEVRAAVLLSAVVDCRQLRVEAVGSPHRVVDGADDGVACREVGVVPDDEHERVCKELGLGIIGHKQYRHKDNLHGVVGGTVVDGRDDEVVALIVVVKEKERHRGLGRRGLRGVAFDQLVTLDFGRFSQERRVGRQAQQLDAVGGVTNARVTDGGAADFLLFLQPDLQMVAAAAEAFAVDAGVTIGVRALDPNVIVAQRVGGTRQDQTHARVVYTRRVHVVVDVPHVAVHRVGNSVGLHAAGLFVGRVVAAGDHVAVRVDQLDDRVEPQGGPIDVDPDLGARPGAEGVDVGIVGVVGTDKTVHVEAQPQIVIAALFIGSQIAERLGVNRHVVVTSSTVGGLGLQDDPDVAIVDIFLELDTSPVAGTRRVVDVVGVSLRFTPRVDARADAVVGQGGEHNGIAGSADDLQRTADAIVEFLWCSKRRQSGILAGELHDETLFQTALEAKPAVRVEVGNDHFVKQHVDNVRIIPDAIDRKHLAADDHAVDRIVREVVFADQRPMVVGVCLVAVGVEPSRRGGEDAQGTDEA